MKNASTLKALANGPIPDWEGLVDQTNGDTMAKFISSFPVAKTITYDEMNRIIEEAVVVAYPSFNNALPHLSVLLNAGGFSVDPAGKNEWFSCFYGNHAVHGHFAVLMSVRGPGPETFPRARPIFLFCDQSAILLGTA